MIAGMDETPDPAASPEQGAAPQERRRDVEVRVRRAPKYGVFAAIGAVVGAVVAWLIAELQPPAVNEAGALVDTTAVIGLIVVVGFVLGGAAGGVAALIADRASAKRGRTLTAERVDVEAPPEPGTREPRASEATADVDAGEVDAGEVDAGEVAFERIDPLTGDALPDHRVDRVEPGTELPDPPQEHDRPDRA